ncbi:hypothetical protein RDI58_019800 [Solanum bulbocastanum]|uniref:Uncharacterized protein n=1 Tax=Solanum bulbocastanum TaxID=147425 RepID=A0AAN8Y7B0_SOLBU
MVQWTKPPDN